MLKNSLTVKKVQPCSKWPMWKNLWNQRGGQEMAAMVRLMEKKLITTIQVKFWADSWWSQDEAAQIGHFEQAPFQLMLKAGKKKGHHHLK